MSFWRRMVGEAHRRSLWQVAAFYLVVGWAAFQVVFTLYEAIGLPEWVPPFALILLIIGLPIVLATAFVQEGGPRRPSAWRVEPGHAPVEDSPDARSATNADDSGAGDLGRRESAVPDLGASAAAPRAARPPGGSGHRDSTATAVPAPSIGGLRSLLTWRRSLLGGVAAFVLLALLTAGFMFERSRTTLVAQGVLDEQDIIVLADFASTGADPTLGEVVTEALRIDLVTSNVIRLAEPSQIGAALSRMRLDPATPLNAETARELALREGIKAVLAGEIGSLGGGYVLTARLVTPTDSALAAFRATARDSTQLIDAVDELSRQVRDKLGERLNSIRATPPLADVTTPVLAALRKYSEAESVRTRTGDQLRAVELLDEAIALDSSFAMAWRKKGVYLANLGIRRDERLEAARRAYELRGRLSEKERYLAIASYESVINGDRDAVIAAYRQVLEIDPDDYISLNNLSVALMGQRRYAEAEPLLVRGTQAPGASRYNFTNLLSVQYRLGRIDEARATLARAKEALPGNAELQAYDATFAAAEHRWDLVDSIARALGERHRENATAQVNVLFFRIAAALIDGRLRDVSVLTADLDSRAAANGLLPQRLFGELSYAEVSLRIRGDQARGLPEIEDALRRYPLDSIPLSERPYGWIAQLYADAGRFDLADAMVERWLRERPPDADADPPPDSWTRAYIALRRGDPEPGLARFRIASSYPEEGSCRACDLDLLGQAYEVAGQPDSARAIYERRLSEPWLGRLQNEADDRPFVLERVAELHELAGDTAKARERYAEFVRLWDGADPELQGRVEAARRRLVALGGAG